METEYLGYVFRDGIKLQEKKVHNSCINAAKKCQRVAQIPWHGPILQRHLGTTKKILAPLTNLVEECGHTKVTKANKTKKAPWHWDKIHQQAFDNVKETIAKDVTLAYPDYMHGLRSTSTVLSYSQDPSLLELIGRWRFSVEN